MIYLRKVFVAFPVYFSELCECYEYHCRTSTRASKGQEGSMLLWGFAVHGFSDKRIKPSITLDQNCSQVQGPRQHYITFIIDVTAQ